MSQELTEFHNAVAKWGVPCCIIVDVDIETDKGHICPNQPSHLWLIEGRQAVVCGLHAVRLMAVGQQCVPINAPELSQCCGMPPLGEIFNDFAICSGCKEQADFSPQEE